MFNDVFKITNSWVVPKLMEARNKDGWLVGCGTTNEEAREDAKTFNEMTKQSDNMKKEGF